MPPSISATSRKYVLAYTIVVHKIVSSQHRPSADSLKTTVIYLNTVLAIQRVVLRIFEHRRLRSADRLLVLVNDQATVRKKVIAVTLTTTIRRQSVIFKTRSAMLHSSALATRRLVATLHPSLVLAVTQRVYSAHKTFAPTKISAKHSRLIAHVLSTRNVLPLNHA